MPPLARAALGVVLVLSGTSAALADRYVAISKTAEAITGDIAMDDSSITFENGRALDFADLVGDSFTVGEEEIPASVYRVAVPSNPKLLGGNRLCDAKVTYVASWSGGEGMTVVAMFSGDEAPESDADMCASFTYEDAGE